MDSEKEERNSEFRWRERERKLEGEREIFFISFENFNQTKMSPLLVKGCKIFRPVLWVNVLS